MTDIRHDLILMVELQRQYNRISEALGARTSPPPAIRELEEANRQRRSELEQLEAQVGEHRERQREVRKREEEYRLELEHFQRQKSMVTNEREFTAVISEIDYATKALDEAAKQRAELEAEIARMEAEIEALRTTQPEEEAAQREVVADWDRRKDELKDEVHDLAAEAKRLESELRPTNRARFHRLLESKRGTAVAELVEGSCSACHFAVRPHLQQRVRRCQEIITCEYCHRILYLPEALDSSRDRPAAD